MNNSVGAVLVVVILVIGLGAGWFGGNLSSFGETTQAVSQTTTVSLPEESSAPKIIYVDIIADWGGSGYDAFVVPPSASGGAPPRAGNSTVQRPDNDLKVPFGVPVTFVITNLDDMMFNYTGHASVDFTIYNNTDDGQVALHYSQGQDVGTIQIGHTFTVPTLNIDVPIPPNTIVTFTYTFTEPGVFEYLCKTPCGPGMGLVGYMNGYLIVG